MERREVIKLFSSTLILSALPPDALSAALSLFQEVHAQTAQSLGLKTLNPHQNATVTVIAEMIIPETETPGAKAAKVNEFIDLLLTEWFDPAETKQFLAGLEQVDAKSRSLYSADFVDAKPEQQVELLTQLDDAGMEFARRQKVAALAAQMNAQMAAQPDIKSTRDEKPAQQMDFFYQMKRLTLVGYYTSEIGFEKELGKTIIPSGHDGCAPMPEVSK